MKQCNEFEIDNMVKSIKSLDGCLKREYWYISQSYLNLGLDEKSDKYLKISQKHLKDISKFIENEKVRNDFIKLPLLHKKIMGIDKITNTDRKSTKEKEEENISNSNIFKFCPSCGFNNENNFKFCPQCGVTLTS